MVGALQKCLGCRRLKQWATRRGRIVEHSWGLGPNMLGSMASQTPARVCAVKSRGPPTARPNRPQYAKLLDRLNTGPFVEAIPATPPRLHGRISELLGAKPPRRIGPDMPAFKPAKCRPVCIGKSHPKLSPVCAGKFQPIRGGTWVIYPIEVVLALVGLPPSVPRYMPQIPNNTPHCTTPKSGSTRWEYSKVSGPRSRACRVNVSMYMCLQMGTEKTMGKTETTQYRLQWCIFMHCHPLKLYLAGVELMTCISKRMMH